MKTSVILIVLFFFTSFTSTQACEHLKSVNQPKPVPEVIVQDVSPDEETDQNKEQDLNDGYTQNNNLIYFGNLSSASFVEDIKALNKLAADGKNQLKYVVVVMDTKDRAIIKKFITDNEIKIRMVIPARQGWEKNWTGVVNRSVFVTHQRNIVASGVDVVGNENLIQETASKLIPGSS